MPPVYKISRKYGRTYVAKPIAALRDFATAPKKEASIMWTPRPSLCDRVAVAKVLLGFS